MTSATVVSEKSKMREIIFRSPSVISSRLRGRSCCADAGWRRSSSSRRVTSLRSGTRSTRVSQPEKSVSSATSGAKSRDAAHSG